jgi:signal transduction histidine kinase
MNNLLRNALHHSPEGGMILITIEQSSQQLYISVKDDGAGIAPEHLEHVFDRFYRTDSARSRDDGGTGLGLAIVRAIVEEHGGQVSVKSPGLGQGSTFAVTIPVK